MQVRWTDGLKAGEVAEVEESVARAFLASGKAVEVEPEVVAEEPEVVETPEEPKRRSSRRKATETPETR